MPKISPDISKKHKHVFIYYTMFLKKHSKNLNALKKSYIYRKVSEPFYLETNQTSKIISRTIRKHYEPTKLDIEEFYKQFEDFMEVCEKND